jgi:para-nitrobenzyl esterase
MLKALGLVAAVLLSGAAAAAPLQVRIKDGPLQGNRADGVVAFRGIPYAAPPVGALRWMPPGPAAPWTKPRLATAFGPACAQITTLGPFAGPATANEDCLYLNVFAPDGGQKNLPVLFWIHGGGNVDGRSDDYDPRKLVRDGHLVVVTINYRLGLFGFLAHPALDGEGHAFGNYAILDQQAALRWVKDNIAAFGGDSHNVTVAGQSAGASSAGINVLSPLARDLFQRAIYESGAYNPLIPLDIAENKGEKFAATAGCRHRSNTAIAACLRKLPARRILSLSGTASANGPYITGPMIDGQVVPGSAIQAYQAGHFNHVPVMNGMVRDEGDFNIGISEYFSGPPRRPVTPADFKAYVAKTYGGNAGPGGGPPAYSKGTVTAILAHYPLKSFASPQLAEDALMTDPITCRSRHIARVLASQVPVYDYEFDERTAPTYFPSMPGYRSLAYHTADLQFLFAGYHGGPAGIAHPLNSVQGHLSDQMVAAWANFARSGNPNGRDNALWPRFTGAEGTAQYLSENIPALSTLSDKIFAARHQCGFWDTLLVY